MTDPKFVLFEHVLCFARIMSTLCPNSCRQSARIGGQLPPCPRPIRLWYGQGMMLCSGDQNILRLSADYNSSRAFSRIISLCTCLCSLVCSLRSGNYHHYISQMRSPIHDYFDVKSWLVVMKWRLRYRSKEEMFARAW